MNRFDQINRFYDILETARTGLRGLHQLATCDSRTGLPRAGVYFFFDHNEPRSAEAYGPRVVRIGTHGLTEKSRATLWARLRQHKGRRSGSGDHRKSVFRKLVGDALIRAGKSHVAPTWCLSRDRLKAHGNTMAAVRQAERPIEEAVSAYITTLPFQVVAIDDPSGPNSLRAYVERNSIALLSNRGKPPIDGASEHWLGRCSDWEKVRASGLWNNQHVDGSVAPDFLDVFEKLVLRAGQSSHQ